MMRSQAPKSRWCGRCRRQTVYLVRKLPMNLGDSLEMTVDDRCALCRSTTAHCLQDATSKHSAIKKALHTKREHIRRAPCGRFLSTCRLARPTYFGIEKFSTQHFCARVLKMRNGIYARLLLAVMLRRPSSPVS